MMDNYYYPLERCFNYICSCIPLPIYINIYCNNNISQLNDLLLIPQLLCVGNIISSALTISSIIDAKDAASDHHVEYRDTDAQIAIAGWLVLVNGIAFVFYLIVIILPVFYPPFAVEKSFKPYLITVSVYMHNYTYTYVTWHEKIGHICTKYTTSRYSTYLTFCESYPSSV